MKPVRHDPPAYSAVRGHLAVIVLVFLVVTGLLLQAMVQWSLGDERIGQSIDHAAQRRAEIAGLENVVKESLLIHYESALTGASPAVNTLIDEGLAIITGGSVQRTAVPSMPDSDPRNFQAPFAAYANGASTALNANFSALVDSSQPRALRRIDNLLLPHLPPIVVRQNAVETFAFDFNRSSPTATSYRITARLRQVPVSDFEIIAYASPAAGTLPAIDSLPDLGPNSLANPAVRVGLALTGLSSGAGAVVASSGLPSSQRELVSFAGIQWSYIWSSNFRTTLTASLPSTQSIVYDLPPEIAEFPDGVTADWDNATLIVSLSSVTGTGLYLRGSDALLTTVALQQGGGSETSPLVLYLDGGTAPTNRLQLQLTSSLTRPCIVYLLNGNLVDPGEARQVTGALFLSPTSTVANGGALTTSLTLNGALAADIAAFPSLKGITVSRVANPTWRGLVPRVLVVQTDGSVL